MDLKSALIEGQNCLIILVPTLARSLHDVSRANNTTCLGNARFFWKKFLYHHVDVIIQ